MLRTSVHETRAAEPGIDGTYVARIATTVRALTNAGSGSADPLELFLREGARSLRPRFVYSTVLARSLGHRFVIESSVCDEVLAAVTGSSISAPGMRLALDSSFLAEVARGNRTVSWNDLTMVQGVPGIHRLQSLGIRSVISTPFQTAGSTYVLSFVSCLSPADGFNRRDDEYVELIASILSLELHRRWQAERVRFHSEHDAATGRCL
jgi:hypothetical protein